MYLLQVCHPNDLLTDGWNTVDEINTIDLGHIESPVFDWYSGLLVRIIDPTIEDIPFEGVYGQTHCINVSYASAIAIKWTIFKNEGFLTMWRTTTDVYHMMKITEAYIPAKTRLSAFIDRLAETSLLVVGESPKQMANLCIGALRGWISGKIDIETIDKMRENLERYQREDDTIHYRAIIEAMWMISSPSPRHPYPGSSSIYYTTHCLMLLHQTKWDDELTKMANLLRSRIPFYDIAIAIGNSQ